MASAESTVNEDFPGHLPGTPANPCPPDTPVKPRDPGLDKSWVPGLIKRMSQANVWLYQASGGRLGRKWRVGSAFRKPVDVLLLTTVGRRSGNTHVSPLLYLERGDTYYVVASRGGTPGPDPAWLFNLKAQPDVMVRVGREVLEMRGRELDDEERTEVWPQLVELYADFANYQSWTSRVIPVVALEPRA